MSDSAPHFLVFQHIACEHPGAFRAMIKASGATWMAVELDEGESIPDLAGFDGLWVMGGPMDVWQKDEHPWLVDEIAAIKEAVVSRKMPYMGLCLGHQLLAEALGGEVGVAKTPEIGVLDVHMTDEGKAHPAMAGVPATLKTLQWHSAEVTTKPDSATSLMSSPVCEYEAMAVGDSVLSMQFHVEIEPTTVRDWGEIPAYANALAQTCGEQALAQMDHDATESISDMTRAAQTIYNNWFKLSFS